MPPLEGSGLFDVRVVALIEAGLMEEAVNWNKNRPRKPWRTYEGGEK